MSRLDLIPNLPYPREKDAPGHCLVPAPTGSKFPFQQFPVFAGAGPSLTEIGMGLSWRTFPWIKGESCYSRLPKGGKCWEEPRYFGKAP